MVAGAVIGRARFGTRYRLRNLVERCFHTLIQECRDLVRGRCVPIHPEKHKEVRFNAACARIEEGKIFLSREAAWLDIFKRELRGFPRSRFED